MSDEPIRDRLKRLRRGLERPAHSARASEPDRSPVAPTADLDTRRDPDAEPTLAGAGVARDGERSIGAMFPGESALATKAASVPRDGPSHDAESPPPEFDSADKSADSAPADSSAEPAGAEAVDLSAQSNPGGKSPAFTPEGSAISTRATIFSRLARRAQAPEPAATSSRDHSLDPPRDLVRSARGTWARTTTFEHAHRHGSLALADVLGTSCAKLAELARDERIAGVDLASAVFFDTETTGLSGGAGTYVFLVGLGRFTTGRFELWQGFLPHPADEKALLEEVAERIAGASAILSFFGKSFDRHRLEDKMRLHGVAPPFAECIHLDLYHPLRRAHRGRFENCKLKTLERELVGVQRGDDLPGSFAPAAWFDFLNRRPHRLEGVFRHNADDVLSLVTLAAHLGR